MKIYVASSWRNPFQQTVVKILRDLNHDVYDFKNPSPDHLGFSWSSVDNNWIKWSNEQYIAALNHPNAIAGFNRDFDAMKWAQCCVLVLPSGRSAHTEAGWMKGSGKMVHVFQPTHEEPELMYKVYDSILCSYAELRSKFQLNK